MFLVVIRLDLQRAKTIKAPPIKKSACLSITIKSEIFVFKKIVSSKAKKKATKMASPPTLGVGLVCIFLSLGKSTARSLTPRFRATGVNMREKIKEQANIIRIVVILYAVFSSRPGGRTNHSFNKSSKFQYKGLQNFLKI